MASKQDKIKQQIEYYLSDENLIHDEYFRKEIEGSPEGFVNLNIFQKCNKIKKLQATNEEILKAVASSSLVESNGQQTSLRRKNNKSLPDFVNKKVKGEDNGAAKKTPSKDAGDEKKKAEEEEHKEEKYEPLVFAITAEKDPVVDWRLLHAEVEKLAAAKVYYTRYNKEEKGGHFVVNKFEITEENKNKLVTNGVSVNDATFKLHAIKDKELEEFWKNHGGHYTLCLERKKEEKGGKRDRKSQKAERKDREKRGNRNQNQLEISLANRKYSDPTKIKNIFKQLLNTTTNGDKIAEPNHTMLKDVLQFHENGPKKLEKLNYFTVGPHPEHKTTRCFFVVREDGTQEVVSCLSFSHYS